MDEIMKEEIWNGIQEEYDLRPSEVEWVKKTLESIHDGIGNVSDGYHTFDELYHHRTLLFAAICNLMSATAWKSKQHHDPNFPMYKGMFIVGVETPVGQATYHCDMKYWDLFRVQEFDRGLIYDGHTPEQAVQRIYDYMTARANPVGESHE